MSILEAAVAKCASNKSQVVLLVDAINESHDMNIIEQALVRVANSCPNIRVLVTTTNTPISTKQQGVSVMDISQEMHGDIDIFIQWRLETDETLKNLTPQFQSEIEANLLRKADGS
jgi:hypothetical protein